MSATAIHSPPLHRLEDQPTNLIATSSDSDTDAQWLLTGAMDQDDVAVVKIKDEKNGVNGSGTMNGGTNGNGNVEEEVVNAEVIPPLQPESPVVRDNKGVPW